MKYHILSINNKESHVLHDVSDRRDSVFFTTDRTVGRDAELLCPMLGVATDRFARPHQTHTDRILRINEDFFSLSPTEREAMMEGIDAVISEVTEACIGISTADCIPVLVYDPVHHAAAAIHAGWRGTVQRIVSKTLLMMQQTYGTDAAQCEAVIGPGISLDSFEVGDEVYEAFAQEQFPMDIIARKYPQRWHIDLKETNRQLLLAAGVKAEHISVSDVDTMTNEAFFSARREQKGDVKCGRLLSGFVLY